MIDPQTLLALAAALFGITVSELTGKRRFARYVAPRQAAAAALRLRGLSLCEIGELLRRDHTTIISSLRTAETRAQTDPAFAARLAALLGHARRRAEVTDG